MENWKISCIDSNNQIIKGFKKDKDCIAAKKEIDGNASRISKDIKHAVKIYKSRMQKDIIESLILAEDCDDDEIEELTGVKKSVINKYKKIFFNLDVFVSKIDLLDYIETGIEIYREDNEAVTAFLLKRWVVTLGKEFIIWRYKLKPIVYAPSNLYNTIMKEAFFYHKEKSMGNEKIGLSEYLKSTSTLLSSVRSSTSIKESSEEDVGLDFMERLDIIMEDKEAPSTTLDELKDEDFINNANSQETT